MYNFGKGKSKGWAANILINGISSENDSGKKLGAKILNIYTPLMIYRMQVIKQKYLVAMMQVQLPIFAS